MDEADVHAFHIIEARAVGARGKKQPVAGGDQSIRDRVLGYCVDRAQFVTEGEIVGGYRHRVFGYAWMAATEVGRLLCEAPICFPNRGLISVGSIIAAHALVIDDI